MRNAAGKIGVAVAVLGLTLGAGGGARAGLTLDSVDAQQLYGSISTVLTDLGTKAVNPVATFHDEQSILDLDVTDSTISITSHFSGLVLFQEADFNGFSFTDVSGSPNITGVTLDPAYHIGGNFDPSRISFTSNAVFVNLENLGFGYSGESLILDLQFSPPTPAPPVAAPEPSTIVSAGIGALMGLGYAWRRRKTRLAV